MIDDTETGQDREDVRHGFSTCESIEALAAYLAQSGIEPADESVIVELEADLVTDEDHDAALGARLVHPISIVSTTPVGDDFHDTVNAAYDAVST